MDENEEVKLKLALHRLLTAITQGGALSDIQRLAAAIANRVEWPYASDYDNNLTKVNPYNPMMKETTTEDTGEEE